MLEVQDMQVAITKAFQQAQQKAVAKVSKVTEDAIQIMEHNQSDRTKFTMAVQITLDIDCGNERAIKPTGRVGWPTVNKKVPFEADQVPMTGEYDPDPDQGKLPLDGDVSSVDTGIGVQDGMTEPPEDYDGPTPD